MVIRMNKLQVGFSRIDNTPGLGVHLDGYFIERYSEGALDPLYINTVAFSDGEHTAILITIDMLGMDKNSTAKWREAISAKTGVSVNSIYVTSSHSHTAPGPIRDGIVYSELSLEFYNMMARRVIDSAVLAIQDLKPARMGYGKGKAENVSFCRRYIMKDGSCRTNPGVGNPDIDHPLKDVDSEVSVLRFDREGAETIVVFNFANHPDVVGGSKFSADWPGAARATIERVFPNVKSAFCNGAQGDINHVNVNPTGGYSNDLFNDFDDVARGYNHAWYIGRVVAAGVMQTYDKVQYVDVESVGSLVKTILIPSNKPTEEEMPEARHLWQMHEAGRDAELPYTGMMLTTKIADAKRKLALYGDNAPDNFEFDLIGLRLGNVAFLGIPGEPFSEVGSQIKLAKNYDFVIPTCLTNGYEGYFPTFDAYKEGGYEAGSSRFKAGVAERIVAGALDVLAELKG